MAARDQTGKEEVWNAITHGAGILFCLIAMPFLIYYAYLSGTASTVWAVSIFGFGMLMVYMASTFFHATQHQGTKRVLQVWDHISIYLLIAGSYTPVVIRFTDTPTAIVFLTVMWSIVGIGCFLKIFYTRRFRLASTILYLALGWMAVFIIKPLWVNMPLSVFWWLLAGGLSYTGGVYFYMREHRQYHHAVWHLFVLAGTVTHYVAIFKSTLLQVNIHGAA